MADRAANSTTETWVLDSIAERVSRLSKELRAEIEEARGLSPYRAQNIEAMAKRIIAGWPS